MGGRRAGTALAGLRIALTMTMNAQRVQMQPAFVLHRRPYRETSWLLEIFSRDHGRIGLVARAARQSRPRGGHILEPARELLLSWTLRGDLGQLGQVETASPARGLGGEQLLSALYLNELLLRLTTRHDPHPLLFDHYRTAIHGLVSVPGSAIPLRRFEKHLLQELGYGLNLERDSEGEPIRAETCYDYRIGQGACPAHGDASELAIRGDILLALREDRLEEGHSRREAKLLLRAALRSHLGQKPLRTPELFRSLRRLKTNTATATFP
jgi:DNA repair protein RecO (recombination protein O)